MPIPTAHWGIPKPELDEPPNGPDQIGDLADFLDSNANGRVPMVQRGILADRPVSTVGVPGKADRRYTVVGDADPANNGREFIDTGTAWIEVASRIPASAAGDGLKIDADDGELHVDIGANSGLSFVAGVLGLNPDEATLTKIANVLQVKDGGITLAKLAAALKPSAGAGAGAEALRALGAGASNAAAGNDARLSDQRVPTDLSVTNAKVAAAAAIARSKLDFGAGLVNADISAAAAIVYSKLALGASIVNADIAAGAAIAESKLALASDAAVGVASRRTLGAGALQAAPGNDARLSDTRVPTDNSVTNAKMADNAVNTAELVDDAVTGAKLNDTAKVRSGIWVPSAQVNWVSGTDFAGAAVITGMGGGITLDVDESLLIIGVFQFNAIANSDLRAFIYVSVNGVQDGPTYEGPNVGAWRQIFTVNRVTGAGLKTVAFKVRGNNTVAGSLLTSSRATFEVVKDVNAGV